MVKRSENILQGMAEIRAYVNRSEATVLRWIREYGFPAQKIAGGTWESDKGLIDKWRVKIIETGQNVSLEKGRRRKRGRGEKAA